MTDRSRPLSARTMIIGLAVVVGVGLVLALARGGDDDGGGDASDLAAFGAVRVEGDALPAFEESAGDEATGQAAPILHGTSPDGERRSIGGAGRPTLVVFLAHWCPHCQAEVPVLVELGEDGAFEGFRLVGVLTGTNPDAPNYPPAPWLEREGWPGEVLVDDEESSAALAYGLTEYPFLVALDDEGRVVARASGEQAPEAVEALLEAAAGSSGP